MKVSEVINNIVNSNAGKFVSNNSGTILTVVGLACGAGAIVMSALNTVKFKEDYEELEFEKHDDGEEVTKKDVAVLLIKDYAATLALAIISGCCVSAGCIINKNKIDSMAAACVLGDKAVSIEQKYFQGKEESEEEVDKRISESKDVYDPDGAGITLTGYGNQLFYENFGGRYFRSSIEHVRSTYSKMVEKLYGGCEPYETYNEWYFANNLPQSRSAEEYGFVAGESEVEYSPMEFTSSWGEPYIELSPDLKYLNRCYKYPQMRQ